MTYLTVNTEADAIRVLQTTRERQAIHAAIYMTLPTDGEFISNHELCEAVNNIVDPIHNHLLRPSDSYTQIEPNGRRTRRAIDASCQTMSARNANKKAGYGWIELNWGRRRYVDGGYDKATAFYEGEGRPILEALTLMLELRNTPIKAEVVPIDTCQDLIDRNQEVIDQVAAAQKADRPEPVETKPEPEKVDGKHPDRDEAISRMNARIFALEMKVGKIEAYDRTRALVKEMLADRMSNNPTGVMADTLKLILESLEL